MRDLERTYTEAIRRAYTDPEALERLYREAQAQGRVGAFRSALLACYAETPDHLLYAAWETRLRWEGTAGPRAPGAGVLWKWALPLAALNGLVFWLLSAPDLFTLYLTDPLTGASEAYIPLLLLLAGPLAALFVLLYLAVAGSGGWQRAGGVVGALIGTTLYALLAYPHAGPRPFQEQYLTLAALHLPLAAWAGVGVYLLLDRFTPSNAHAFLLRTLEVFIVGGLFAGAGGLFTAVTAGLFAALDVQLPEVVQRLLFAGGGGLIPVLAVAVLYDPTRAPKDQAFHEGLSRLVSLLMRFLLPLSLVVLAVYAGFIPFRFWEPFQNRDVLIVYNAMLFGVMALLVGAAPLQTEDLSPAMQIWLRRGIVALAGLALLVSLYALAAILYRTAMDRLTPNRFAFIGWNVVNSGLLGLLLRRQVGTGPGAWLQRVQEVYRTGMVAYAGWTLVVLLAVPWLFTVERGAVAQLPLAVQDLVYTQAPPILLKCLTSPHIYLLDGGQKRWIVDIPTFEARGYRWQDVHLVSCRALRQVPSGPSIPPDAGPPPEP